MNLFTIMPDASRELSDLAAAALLEDVLMPEEIGGEQVGDQLGAWTLIEKIGEGGFGLVWRVEQREPVRREAALKLLKLGMDSRQVLARFEQERRVLAAMDHPCIATMFDAGMSPDGRPYFVMELLHGLPLTSFCQKHALSLQDRIALFRDVCSAVQHAHQKGVIHRDLKPSNILVTEVDGKPVPKVIDFGIAKALATERIAAMTMVTQANFILGTPQYMSPEQIADVGNVDTRSDVYALGTLLYEVLTGSPPFDPKTHEAKGPQEFRRVVQDLPPKRPSTILTARRSAALPAPSLADVARLPQDLDWITLKALEKEPQRRYQSAAEFGEDLQRFLRNEPVSAHPPSTRYVVARWIGRNRVVSAAACFSVVALVAGAGLALWQASVARAAQARAEVESTRSRETAEFLTSLLTEVAEEVRKGRNPEALRQALITSQKRIEALTGDPELQIALTTKIADLFEGMSDRQLVIPTLKRRVELIAAYHGPDSQEARDAEYAHLLMVVDQGARIEATQMLPDLRRRIEAHEGRGSPNWFRAQYLLVRVWIKLRRGVEAVTAADEAVEEARRVGLAADRLFLVLVSRAEALETKRDFAAAEAQLQECLQVSATTSRSAAHRLEVEHRLVDLELSRGDLSRAADLQAALLERARGEFVPDDPSLLFHLQRLADIERRAQRYEAAVEHAGELLGILRSPRDGVAEAGGSADTSREHIVKALCLQADALRSLKRQEQADDVAKEALRIARQGGNHSLISEALDSLSACHEAAGRLDEAWQVQKENYELHAEHNGSYKNRIEDLIAMSGIRSRQRLYSEALEHLRDAWVQTLAEPLSRSEPDYLAHIAKSALRSWQTLKAADPAAPVPAELAAWEQAVENRRGSTK